MRRGISDIRGNIRSLTLLVLIFLICIGGIYALYRPAAYTLVKDTYDLNNMGKESKWFKAEGEGLSCTTWLTCTSEGAVLKEIYIKADGVLYPLGKRQGRVLFIDQEGNSPVGIRMQSCVGKDEGISFDVKRPIIRSLYKDNNAVHVFVTIRNEQTGAIKQYSYDLPHDFSLKDDTYEAVIVYQAVLNGEEQTYTQSAYAQKCTL